MTYISELTKIINDGLEEQKDGPDFEVLPEGIVQCGCKVGLKAVKSICETAKLPKPSKPNSRHKCKKPPVVAAIYRIVADDETGKKTAQVIPFLAKPAGLAAATKFTGEPDETDLGETIDGHDPGPGLATVIYVMFTKGFEFDDEQHYGEHIKDEFELPGLRDIVMLCPAQVEDTLTAVLYWTKG